MAVPEGMVVLDFVGFTDKGNYSSSEVYMENDLTHWKNTVWKCKADDTVNEEPSNSSVFWEVFIEGEKPVYGSYETFPRPGEVEKFYVDNTVDPRLMYTWDPNMNDYVLTGGAGGADGGSVDIPVTLIASKWTGSTSPYSQEVILPQMREDMTPLHFLDGESDDMQYAYSLITDYEVSYGKITFYASDRPSVDIDLVLKGIPAQEVEYVDNTIIVPVQPSGFSLNSTTNRYEQTILVSGMTVGTGGTWDIIRSGTVLTLAESKISANITDVERLDGAVKIICTELPTQPYMLSLSSTYAEATEGDTLLADMQGWFDKVNGIQSDISDEFSQSKAYVSGDYCIYLNRLYKFTEAKPAGAWDGTKVVPCTIGQELSSLNSQSQALLSKVGNFSYGEVFRSTTKTGKSEFTLYNWSRSYIVTINTAQNTVAIYFLTRYGERNFVVTEIKSVSGVIVTATESKLNIEYANYYDVVIFKMW